MFQDLHFGIRMLRKNPGFTLVAALSLALGIGVNTSVFTLIYSLVWRPLPVKDAAVVVNISQTVRGDNYGRRSEGGGPISYPEYVNYRDQTRSFAGLAAYAEETLTLTGVETERINAQMVTDNYFSVLGGEVALGRVFVPNECQTPGACPQVVLSYAFWRRRFSSDPNVIGRALILNRRPLTVMGVTARSWSGMGMNGASHFDLPVIAPDVWVPLMMRGQLAPERDMLSQRDCSCHSVIGRLKNDVSLKQAQADMDVAAGQLDQNELVTNNRVRKTNAIVMPGSALNVPEIRGFVIPFGIALLAALGLVLVVACANVSNLLLARAVARQKEIGVRLALGASRGRLIRQLMTESLLLALLGGGGGMLLASWAPALIFSVVPVEGLNLDVNPNWTVFAYCFLTSLLTAILFGLAPAFQATRLNLVSMIKAEGTMLGRRISGSRLRNLLVVIQVAVSFTLLVCAGLLFRGVQRAQSADLGFEPKNVFVLSLDLASAGYNAQRAAMLNDQLNDRLAALPGVESVSFSRVLPFSGIGMAPITLEGQQPNPRLQARYRVVSPGYFHTLGIPIIRGRHFTEQEIQAKRPYVVISQAMAERFWPGQDPIGKRFNSVSEVIGVARDTRSMDFERLDRSLFYSPAFAEEQSRISFLLRVGANQQGLPIAAKEAVRSLDKNVAVTVIRLEEVIARKLQPSRIGAIFSIALSLLTLALATSGIYGVMAFLVSNRTREIGIRKALGAQTSDVLGLVIRQGMTLVVIGLVIGLALALALTRFIAGQLYGVSATDPATFTAIALLLATVALVACWIPARRAAKVDPMVALRCE
jgi:macrolide transport system ATP-binding/permease protein